mmetsp:Transcript_14051/g.25380  ORF Transcript_14051/g.25380 Transcript_14051/m.25380 type:complete len:509 (+) Transcript_14051:2107-3633(+)
MRSPTDSKTVTIMTATWNCNAQVPSKRSLEAWLTGQASGEEGCVGADMYIIGLQETVELKAKEVFLNRDVSGPWQKQIERALGATGHGRFRPVIKIHLVGMLLLVYATEHIARNIDGVQEYTVGVGVMGVGGNKGSVAARFRLFGHRLMVLNMHLTAHQQNCDSRNKDLQKIWKKFSVEPSGHGLDDLVFAMGDLNYRLDIKDGNIVKTLIDKKDWGSLLAFEQLIRQRAENKVFLRFTEGKIAFPPTFKFKTGTNEYSEKRVPAWCDRVLWWRDQRTCSVVQRWYRSIEEVYISDHKPVCALFDVTLRGAKPGKFRSVSPGFGHPLMRTNSSSEEDEMSTGAQSNGSTPVRPSTDTWSQRGSRRSVNKGGSSGSGSTKVTSPVEQAQGLAIRVNSRRSAFESSSRSSKSGQQYLNLPALEPSSRSASESRSPMRIRKGSSRDRYSPAQVRNASPARISDSSPARFRDTSSPVQSHSVSPGARQRRVVSSPLSPPGHGGMGEKDSRIA